MIPHVSWFCLQPPSHLHGLGHTARVMVWACVLTAETEWFDEVMWAAACHDLRRWDDGADPEHGFRAGQWVRTELAARLTAAPKNLELIASACDWHVAPDRVSKFDHPVLWYLKDADGLDRVRLGYVNKSMLRHKETPGWVDTAEKLYNETRNESDPQRIWRAAVKLGLPVAKLSDWARTSTGGHDADSLGSDRLR